MRSEKAVWSQVKHERILDCIQIKYKAIGGLCREMA